MTTAAPPRQVRVGIYTRQSVASDLEFGSIDAQREAVEAFVKSQRGEGWVALPDRYDDHGFSGGTVDRPAFQRLVADIAAGKIDLLATYKIDRVSRSLTDFTAFMSMLEKRSVGFVATTQSFDTRTSMGRLTLNILASFSQFEREVAGERIRDKVQATKRRGMFCGGRPILGYDIVAKKLIANADEANQVREIFALYTNSGSLREVVTELRRRGWTNKTFVGKKGREITGFAFTKATLHGLLNNVLYRGQIRCRDGVVPGVHEAIISDTTWNEVQEQLRANSTNGGAHVRNKTGALLRGLVTCGRCGSPYLHTFTTRGPRRHRYYTCSKAHNEGATSCPDARVAAGKFEVFIANQIARMGTDEVLLAKTAASATQLAADRRAQIADERRRIEQQQRRGQGDEEQVRQREQRLVELQQEADAIGDGTVDTDKLRIALAGFTPIWEQLFPREQERILRLLIDRVTYHPDGGNVDLELRPCGIDTLAAEATEST